MIKNEIKEIEMEDLKYLPASALDAANLPSVVMVDEWIVEIALENDSDIHWCEVCRHWISMQDDDGFWLPTCWCA